MADILGRINRASGAIIVAIGLVSYGHAQKTACSAPPEIDNTRLHETAANYTNLGNWYADHRQFACAVDAFENARKLEPESAHVNYLLGLSLYMGGHGADAVDPLQQSVQKDPGVLKPHLILASVLAELGKNHAAEDQWEAALKLDPHSEMAREGLCKVLLAENRPEPVVALLESARLDEKLAADLAQAYVMEYKLPEAAKVLERALKTYPSSLVLVYGLVTISVRQGHPEEGARIAEEFARAHPHDMSAQKIYLRTQEFEGNPAVALPLARKLLAVAPRDPEVLYLAGMNECDDGQYEQARKHLEEAISLDPATYGNKYNALYHLGTALFELNDFNGAKEQLEKALNPELHDSNEFRPQARWEYAMALRNLGEADQAREQLTLYEQEKQELDNRTLAAQKTITAADEVARGEPQKAVARYREAIAATPNDAGLNYKLALALDSTGDFAGERAALERAVKIDPSFALARYQLGYVESQQGDLSAAEEQFHRAVEAVPGYTQAWISLAATLGMESRFPEAQQAVAHALRLAPNDAEALQLRKDLTKAQNQH
jgi:tetratricopeptide (TPR) repeat protein